MAAKGSDPRLFIDLGAASIDLSVRPNAAGGYVGI